MTISRREALLGTLAIVPALAATRVVGGAKDPAPAWDLPAKRRVRIIENTWVPMPDGARLAARLWIPEGAETSPVPVVLEYIPYRMRDAYRSRDDRWGPQLAQYGDTKFFRCCDRHCLPTPFETFDDRSTLCGLCFFPLRAGKRPYRHSARALSDSAAQLGERLRAI